MSSPACEQKWESQRFSTLRRFARMTEAEKIGIKDFAFVKTKNAGHAPLWCTPLGKKKQRIKPLKPHMPRYGRRIIMSYKPILFSTPMVQAILEGRKTMTRRVIYTKYDNTELVLRTDKYGTRIVERQTDAMPNHLMAIVDKKPTYNVGDILWVRETWRKWVGGYSYKADAQDTFQWRSSRYMPKKAARIFLRVTDVRVERLQDITEDDVVAEGAEKLITCQHQHGIIKSDGTLGDMCWNGTQACSFCTMGMTYSELFGKIVWDSLNAKRKGGIYAWDKNPWVWVYSFERTDKPC